MKNINLHFIGLFLLSFNYLFSLVIFSDITLFYIDALDSEIVYNKIIGEAYKYGFEELDIFLNGQINHLFLRRFFSPLIVLYALFNVELAYWLTDIIVKIVSYFSFFILAKKILGKNIFTCLVAVLFAIINSPTHLGLGLAIMPYLLYLTFSEKKLKIKHYLIIFFVGLNTDIVTTILSIPFLIIISLILKPIKTKEEVFNYIKIYIFFIVAIFISNLNLIILFLSDIQLHRIEMQNANAVLADLFKKFLVNFFKFYPSLTIGFIKSLPVAVLIFSICFFTFKLKRKELIYLFLFYFLLTLVLTITSLESLDLFLKSKGITFNIFYMSKITQIYCCLTILLIFKYEKSILKYFLLLVIFFSVSFAQLSSSIVPFYKKFILKEKNYRNIYTFQGYYLFDIYKNIKSITNNNRTISIGLDPMIAVMNNIHVIDGYHNLYPLDYKKKFYPIIKGELEKNQVYADYYNKWGNRVYAFINDPSDIKIDFKKAKEVGAKFVISKYDLASNSLEIVKKFGQNNFIKLYRIR